MLSGHGVPSDIDLVVCVKFIHRAVKQLLCEDAIIILLLFPFSSHQTQNIPKKYDKFTNYVFHNFKVTDEEVRVHACPPFQL